MVFERHATKLGKPRPCMGRARSPIARGSKSAFSPYAAGNSADIFAVGTSITGRPPHRSERAQFGHSAPTLGVSDGRAHTYHAALRTRSNACDTLSRSCARHVLCWPAFPSVPVLGSTGSAADRSTLFVGFVATTTVMLPRILCARRRSGREIVTVFRVCAAH